MSKRHLPHVGPMIYNKVIQTQHNKYQRQILLKRERKLLRRLIVEELLSEVSSRLLRRLM
jgi:hypothetical protein